MELTRDKVDLNQVFQNADTCLHICARNNDSQMAEVLLWKGASAHIVDHLLQTPLYVALTSKSIEVSLILIDNASNMQDLLSWMLDVITGDIAKLKEIAKLSIQHVADSGDEKMQEDFIGAIDLLPDHEKTALRAFLEELDLLIDVEDNYFTQSSQNVQQEMYETASTDSGVPLSTHESPVSEALLADTMTQRSSSTPASPLDDQLYPLEPPRSPDSDTFEFSYLDNSSQVTVWQLHEAPQRIAVLHSYPSFEDGIEYKRFSSNPNLENVRYSYYSLGDKVSDRRISSPFPPPSMNPQRSYGSFEDEMADRRFSFTPTPENMLQANSDVRPDDQGNDRRFSFVPTPANMLKSDYQTQQGDQENDRRFSFTPTSENMLQ